MSTHNLCFAREIRKIGTPLHIPVVLYKSGVEGGIYCTYMFYWSPKRPFWHQLFVFLQNGLIDSLPKVPDNDTPQVQDDTFSHPHVLAVLQHGYTRDQIRSAFDRYGKFL